MSTATDSLEAWIHSWLPRESLRDPASAVAELARRWSERHRYWHGVGHLRWLVDAIRAESPSAARSALLLTALYHDAIYDPTSGSNEEESAQLWLSHAAQPEGQSARQIAETIRATAWKTPPESELTRRFFALDTYPLDNTCPLSERVRYEQAIFREYQWLPFATYREKRAEFLKRWARTFPDHSAGTSQCLDLLGSLTPRIALYPGSFNPFHLGHLSILRQAEKAFDKIILAVGINRQKPGAGEAMAERLARLQSQLRFHQVTGFGGLLSDYIGELDHPVTVVRGVRDGTDLEAELRFARFLNDLRPDTQIVWIAAELQHVSSSGIRELESFKPGAGARYIPTLERIYHTVPPSAAEESV